MVKLSGKIIRSLKWVLAGMAIFLFLSYIPETINYGVLKYQPYFFMLIGGIFGATLAMVSYRITFYDKLHYIIYSLMRYLLGYHLVVSAYLKIEGKYWNIGLSRLDSPMIDLNSVDIYQGFFAHSEGYQITIGMVQLIAASLIFFRKTALISAIVLLFFLSNAFCINYFFEMGSMRYISTYLFLTIIILVFQLEILQNLWYSYHKTNLRHPLFSNTNLYQALNILKLIIISGPLVMYLWKTEKYSYNNMPEHDLAGTWIVEQVNLPPNSTDKDSSDLRLLEKIYIENRVWGNAKVGDTTTWFKYVIDTSYNQLEFYGFEEYRSWDIKGRYKLEYDKLIYKARNNKNDFEITLVRDERFEKLRAGQPRKVRRQYNAHPFINKTNTN